MKKTMLWRAVHSLVSVLHTRMPSASEKTIVFLANAIAVIVCSCVAAATLGGLQLLGVVDAVPLWALIYFSWALGIMLRYLLAEVHQAQTGRANPWGIAFWVLFITTHLLTLAKVSWWVVVICLLATFLAFGKDFCRSYPRICQRVRTKMWSGIKKSFRSTKVHTKRFGRSTARWWRNDAKPWIKATVLPWLGSALKWFFGLLWENKWAILALGGAYLTWELYNPKKGEWWELWKWGKQSWWWITSITVAAVATLVWLPSFRAMLFEHAGAGIGVVASTYRTYYNGIAGKWKGLYWLSLLGTPALLGWLWSNHHRGGLSIIFWVGFALFVLAHFGKDGDKASKKVADAWEGAKTATR